MVRSAQPDGLEWSLARATGSSELKAPDQGPHRQLARLQSSLALLPDYDLPAAGKAKEGEEAWPAVSAGKSLAGLAGGIATLVLVVAAALLLRRRRAP